MLFTDTLLHPFRFPPYGSFFSNDKEIRGLFFRNITKMRSLIWYAKPTLDFCMLNTKV